MQLRAQDRIEQVTDRLDIEQPVAVACGNRWSVGHGDELCVHSPIDGSVLATFPAATAEDTARVAEASAASFLKSRVVPAPKRGEVVRRIGQRLRERKADLALLVTLESGKIVEEALGEVQEMIDICDFAVGLSRQLYGLSIVSERPEHRLSEQWHPLGPVGVISAFNFPVAVWAWNAMLALVCGDTVVWKPSEKTPLCALACQRIVDEVLTEFPELPSGVSSVVIGSQDVGQAMAASPLFPLVSATGSVGMGRAVAQTVAGRLGRTLLELGGNNAAIVAPSADLKLALRGIVFSAAGTCGQRCTTLRRLIVHRSLADSLVQQIEEIYAKLPIGNPLDSDTLVGPLIDVRSAEHMAAALRQAKVQGGKVYGGDCRDCRVGPDRAAGNLRTDFVRSSL